MAAAGGSARSARSLGARPVGARARCGLHRKCPAAGLAPRPRLQRLPRRPSLKGAAPPGPPRPRLKGAARRPQPLRPPRSRLRPPRSRLARPARPRPAPPAALSGPAHHPQAPPVARFEATGPGGPSRWRRVQEPLRTHLGLTVAPGVGDGVIARRSPLLSMLSRGPARGLGLGAHP